MRECGSNAIDYVEGPTRDEFLDSSLQQSAVAMMIVVIGEIATTIAVDYPVFASTHADVRWTSMRNMRNRIAHGYYDLNWEVVWDTVDIDLPPLLTWVDAVMDVDA